MIDLSLHLPVLQVVVPLIVAPLIVLFRNKNVALYKIQNLKIEYIRILSLVWNI